MQRSRREGWAEQSCKGSHAVFRKDGRTVIVPNHPHDLALGTLRRIFRDAGWRP
jgi:predicted RNA binding protein YcfA (HicA-like mRNA interferase family)